MKDYQRILLGFCFSIFLYSLLSYLGAFDQRLKSIAFYLCFSCIIMYAFYKEWNWKYILILYFPLICIELPLRLYIGFGYDISTIVSSILPALLAGLILFPLRNKSRYLMYTGAFAGLIFMLWFNVMFYFKWINFCDYGSFTGTPVVTNKVTGRFEPVNQSLKAIDLSSDDRLIVIDVWNEACNVCYKKFPVFSEIMNTYRHRQDIRFITGLHPVKQNFKAYASEVDSIYHFNTYILNDSHIKSLHIDFYPTVAVIQSGRVVFTGSVELLNEFLATR